MYGAVVGASALGKKVGCRAVCIDKNGRRVYDGFNASVTQQDNNDSITASPEWMTITRAYERID